LQTVAFDHDDRRHHSDAETLSKIRPSANVDTDDIEGVVVSASLQHGVEIAVDAAR
jgi:hypothetical protein